MHASIRRAVLVLLGFAVIFVARAQDDDEGEFDDQDIDEEALTAEQLQQLHAKFDKNSDGRVSFAELMTYTDDIGKAIASKDITAILEETDTSKDGLLSLEEHMADITNQADGGDEEELRELAERKVLEEAKFTAADVNKDGVLDKAELPALFYPETHEPVLHITVKHAMSQKDTNNDGKLNPHEFWEADPADGEEGELSEEEHADFKKMDLNSDGHLDLQELRHWESGRFHTEEAMKRLFEIADKDNDLHLTASELAEARESIAVSDAQYHLLEWVEHHEL